MKVKFLTTAILLSVTATAATAATLNIRHEFSPNMDSANGDSHKDRVSVSHRFKNGIGFEIEAKWKANKSGNSENASMSNVSSSGHQANVSYVYKFGDGFSLKPQYKMETSSTKIGHQFNLSLGYKVNSDWSVSFRHRYHYNDYIDDEGTNYHYNRWTFSTGYSGVEDWKFGFSTDYQFDQESKRGGWKDEKNYFKEFNFTSEYKGLESGWRPFGEIGFTPYKPDDSSQKDSWRPRFRIGLKYGF